jgi:hypothetical protein
MRAAKRLLLIALSLTGAAGLSACGSFQPDTRPAFGYTGMESGATPQTSYDKGKADFLAGRYGLAIQQFQKAMAEQPASVEAANGLAASYDQIGRFDLAKRYYRRALTTNPNSAQTLNNLGYSLYLQGKYDLAVALLSDASLQAPDNLTVVANGLLAEAAWQRELRRSESLAIARQQEVPASRRLIAGEATAGSRPGPKILRVGQGVQHLELSPQPQGGRVVRMVPAAFHGPAIAPPRPQPVEIESLDPPTGADELRGSAVAIKLPPQVRVAPAASGRDVVVSPLPPAPAPQQGLAGSLEIANGTGRRRMAARMEIYLESNGLEVAWLSNADHFSHARTTITYRPGHAAQAEALAATLPITPGFAEAPEQKSAVRLQLGGDLLQFDHGLQQTQRMTTDVDESA